MKVVYNKLGLILLCILFVLVVVFNGLLLAKFNGFTFGSIPLTLILFSPYYLVLIILFIINIIMKQVVYIFTHWSASVGLLIIQLLFLFVILVHESRAFRQLSEYYYPTSESVDESSEDMTSESDRLEQIIKDAEGQAEALNTDFVSLRRVYVSDDYTFTYSYNLRNHKTYAPGVDLLDKQLERAQQLSMLTQNEQEPNLFNSPNFLFLRENGYNVAWEYYSNGEKVALVKFKNVSGELRFCIQKSEWDEVVDRMMGKIPEKYMRNAVFEEELTGSTNTNLDAPVERYSEMVRSKLHYGTDNYDEYDDEILEKYGGYVSVSQVSIRDNIKSFQLYTLGDVAGCIVDGDTLTLYFHLSNNGNGRYSSNKYRIWSNDKRGCDIVFWDSEGNRRREYVRIEYKGNRYERIVDAYGQTLE